MLPGGPNYYSGVAHTVGNNTYISAGYVAGSSGPSYWGSLAVGKDDSGGDTRTNGSGFQGKIANAM